MRIKSGFMPDPEVQRAISCHDVIRGVVTPRVFTDIPGKFVIGAAPSYSTINPDKLMEGATVKANLTPSLDTLGETVPHLTISCFPPRIPYGLSLNDWLHFRSDQVTCGGVLERKVVCIGGYTTYMVIGYFIDHTLPHSNPNHQGAVWHVTFHEVFQSRRSIAVPPRFWLLSPHMDNRQSKGFEQWKGARLRPACID